jgi:hypothetical protein
MVLGASVDCVVVYFRNKKMRAKEFTYGLLIFIVVYFSIQAVLAYFGGYL